MHIFLPLQKNNLQIYPLWVCPYTQSSCPGMIRQRTGRNILYVDIGAYGITEKPTYDPIETTRKLEEFVRSVNGFVNFCTLSSLYF